MNQKLRTYEGMFLLEAGKADFEAASEPVRNILARYEAQVLAIKPWDERRLAYEISGHKRGLYVLTYFKADPARIAEMEHDCQLSEQILRALILQRPRVKPEEVEAPTPATSSARRSEGRRGASERPAAPRRTARRRAPEAPPEQAEGSHETDKTEDRKADQREGDETGKKEVDEPTDTQSQDRQGGAGRPPDDQPTT